MPVTVDQIAVEIGRSTPNVNSVEYEQIQQWIDRTYRDIQRRFRDSYAALDPEAVDDVVILAVSEHARNPEGWDSRDVSVDDARTSIRYKHSSGRIVILDEWWEMLTPKRESGAFTVHSPFRPGFA